MIQNLVDLSKNAHLGYGSEQIAEFIKLSEGRKKNKPPIYSGRLPEIVTPSSSRGNSPKGNNVAKNEALDNYFNQMEKLENPKMVPSKLKSMFEENKQRRAKMR